MGDSLSLLNSRNGILSEGNKCESDYIITPTCSCGNECRGLENGDGEVLQNGTQENKEVSAEEGGKSKKQRDKPQRQKYLDRVSFSAKTEEQKEEATETLKDQESAAAEPDDSQTDAQTQAPNTDFTDRRSVCDVAGSIIFPASVTPRESDEPFPADELISATRLDSDLQVPAAPSKPLPVPQPRKFKKPTLVRQDGVESGAQEEQKQEVSRTRHSLSFVELKRDSYGDERYSFVRDDDADAPVPPPRQTSLSPRLHKNAFHSLDVLSNPEPQKKENEERRGVDNDEEEDGYGDFERYPITHSLPKQIKLGCHPRRAFSNEEHPSPRAPPRKPQRHSLPAPPPPSICPPAPPHANTPMRELPAPPQEKTAWRFTRPCVTFFSRQVPARSSVPPKGRAPAALGGKQRAQSFSAADLATRADSHKRSLSFRKLLELRLSVKMLPKLLAKGGQSLDCTSAESRRGERGLERPKSCIGEADICGESGDVEYENVPLYEEIPEYMNLPFHSGRLGWNQDSDDSDIYEVQDPYHRYQDHEYERYGTGSLVSF